MDGAAENGHLDVIQWLYVNRFEGCTQKAIEGALSNGHLRVAEWLHSHLPSLIPASVELWRRPANLFEMLLFQYRHFSFSPSLVEYAKEILMDASSKSKLSPGCEMSPVKGEVYPSVKLVRDHRDAATVHLTRFTFN
ncbi:hypothetical protein PI124_g15124 [Phytophthora idaei]|nr:hypothetical protein PI124_g15124 [Phytophthora idaei]